MDERETFVAKLMALGFTQSGVTDRYMYTIPNRQMYPGGRTIFLDVRVRSYGADVYHSLAGLMFNDLDEAIVHIANKLLEINND